MAHVVVMCVNQTHSHGRHMSDPSSVSRKVGYATTSTTSVIKENEIRCMIKQAASGIKGKACGAHVAAHLNRRYNVVNA